MGIEVAVVFYLWLIESPERHGADRLLFLGLEAQSGAQTTVGLIDIRELLAVGEDHLVDAGPFEGHEEVILIRWQISVAG